MNLLTIMNEDDIRYICFAIGENKLARGHAITYFMANQKEFVKIRPGFRVNKASLAKLDIGNLLFRYKTRGFIEFFLEKIVGDWLDQIKKHYEECLSNEDSEEMALVNTLPFCFFADNIRLYFKLTNEEHPDETILFLEAAVKKLKENGEKIESQENELKVKEAREAELRDNIESNRVSADSLRQRLAQAESSARELRVNDKEIHALQVENEKKADEIERLEKEAKGQDATIHELKSEIANIKSSIQLLEDQIRAEMTQQNEEARRLRIATSKPKRPGDIDEFADHLQYNFESLGIKSNEQFMPLLKTHLSHVLFEATPIVINRRVGLPLMRCVSNSIMGNPEAEILYFRDGLSVEEVDDFMVSAGRILCLDNFIGNFNESTLISLFERHRGHIIFLTCAYDRMLKYISAEFMKYGQYLNLNRIAAFNNPAELTEDPSTIDEVEYAPQSVQPDNRFSQLMREILGELGYPKGVVEYMCTTITDETDLCCKLAFDILPYCTDVMQTNPFNVSARLNKYTNVGGKSPNKDLLRRWFA